MRSCFKFKLTNILIILIFDTFDEHLKYIGNVKHRTSIRYHQYWGLVRRRIFDLRQHTHWLVDKKQYYRHRSDFRDRVRTMVNMKPLYINHHNFQWANEYQKQLKVLDPAQDHTIQKRLKLIYIESRQHCKPIRTNQNTWLIAKPTKFIKRNELSSFFCQVNLSHVPAFSFGIRHSSYLGHFADLKKSAAKNMKF